MELSKPTRRIAAEIPFEYDLLERVTRTMQDSPLFVLGTAVMSGIPAALGGDPNDQLTSMLVTMTLVTDARRGWLVLVEQCREVDMAVEMTELLEDLLAGVDAPPPFVVREGTRYRARCRPRALDLRDAGRAAKTVERAFEAAFGGRPEADLEPLLPCLRAYNFPVWDEAKLRAMVSENDPRLRETA